MPLKEGYVLRDTKKLFNKNSAISCGRNGYCLPWIKEI